MLELSPEEFESLVADGLDSLHDDMLDQLDNVIFVIEDVPEDGTDVLGVYEGFSLAERDVYGYGEQPDRIILFRKNLLAHCADHDELVKEIRITLVHEIAHFYGLSEQRIHELGWG
ncbi:putative Zn-dependent protease with MMP-like domain [Leucobacter exalbidus]|uniref:Zn-dependent protease with MMP-like domain n=1 Tax=Leucobacter exalbidus TaxID=662960 RepID=A0A940PRE3_9MICO|nr:metallopeptidase family protein [Leucobacter exalbidus]MBP1324845.1 putative Zn-dependent protease with MMP-like domain [Leucobacter exalbidus]